MNQFFAESHINFPKLWRITMPVSLVLIVLSLGLFFVRGKAMLGVDFTGGTQVTFDCKQQVSPAELEKTLKGAGYDATVTYKFSAAESDSRKVEVLIRDDMTAKSSNPKDELLTMLNKAYPEAGFSGGIESSVGGLIGWEFSKAALLAILFSTIGIGIYVTIRYEFSYAMASILSLIHDVIVVMGIYVAMGRTISLTVVAAVLTVIGYSMNDTVVVFDRIRENVHLKMPGSYIDVVSNSLNQTMSRTLLTSLTTFLVVVVLYIWGGVAINDFVLIMMLGIIVGTYSSLFIASPVISVWHKRVGRLDRDDPEVHSGRLSE